jgi:hypothetical protein
VRLNVQLSCDLANVPPAAADAFKASADRLFNAALERVKELAAAYADAAGPPRPIDARDACRGRHSLAARAVSDAAAGIASVLIVAEEERAEAERLVGAHCATIKDRDPLAPVVVAGRLTRPVVVASGREAGEFFATYGRVKGRHATVPPHKAAGNRLRCW